MVGSRTRRTAPRVTLGERTVVLGVPLSSRASVPPPVVIEAGTGDWLRLPTADAQRLLRQVTRLVADLPRGTSGAVVWQSGANELLVSTDEVTVDLAPGLVTIGIPVGCDQLGRADHGDMVSVRLAVGTTKQLRGLFVSAFQRPAGPATVTATWADALTAFAWESLLTLAQHLAATAGRDRRNRPLIPGAIAAERGALLVKPMVRNEP